ncbi:radical SAM protein [Candidatus Woesearchaeota archaeon]|nr:radical SAM protein [Candidatus Woesearchaeota archaeon]
MLFLNKPNLVMYELTNLCNLRCVMCGIWAEPNKKMFSLNLFENLLKNKVLNNVQTIALTGGEPFLIHNLKDYYSLARKYSPKSHVNISTNGYFTDRILNFLANSDQSMTSVTISYDGVYSHDSVRRVDGSQKRLLETAEKIKKLFSKVKLSLKLTVTPLNYKEIFDTAIQCKSLGIPFLFKTMEKINCHQNRYKSDIDEPNYNQDMINSIKIQSEKILNLGIETNSKYIEKLITQYSGKYISCNCSAKRVFIGIDGKVFLCRKKEPIGDLNNYTFDQIWSSDKKEKIAEEMKMQHGDNRSLPFIYN